MYALRYVRDRFPRNFRIFPYVLISRELLELVAGARERHGILDVAVSFHVANIVTSLSSFYFTFENHTEREVGNVFPYC